MRASSSRRAMVRMTLWSYTMLTDVALPSAKLDVRPSRGHRLADVSVLPIPYGRWAMPSADLSAVRYVDVDASLVTFCSRCRHSEFVHGERESGLCLFNECRCPWFFPMVERMDP